jgi:hypothetical protein
LPRAIPATIQSPTQRVRWRSKKPIDLAFWLMSGSRVTGSVLDPVEFVEAAEEIEEAGFAERIEDLRAAAFVLEDADVAEDGEVIRDRGHVEPDEGGEVGDTAFPRAEGIDDEEPVRIREGLENRRSRPEIGRRFGREAAGGGGHALVVLKLAKFQGFGKWRIGQLSVWSGAKDRKKLEEELDRLKLLQLSDSPRG